MARQASVLSRVYCTSCGHEIEGCNGAFGSWMHSDTRRELGEDGHVASPETPSQAMILSTAAKRRAAVGR